jgi:hypothetical protein
LSRKHTIATETASAAAVAVKFKLDENLPISSAAILSSAGHDVDTVIDEGLIGAPDQDVTAAAHARTAPHPESAGTVTIVQRDRARYPDRLSPASRTRRKAAL